MSVPLDGNAVAGLLHDVFGTDVMAAVGECAHCGHRAPLAETASYVRGPGVVLRCRGCEGLLVVVVEVHGIRCLDLLGLRALTNQAARPGPAPRGVG